MAHDHNSPEYLVKQSKLFWGIGGILGIATVLTVLIAKVDFGSHEANITVGLLLATVKAAFVALIFMHLNSEKKMIYKIIFFTTILALALFFLTWLAFTDPLWSKVISNF